MTRIRIPRLPTTALRSPLTHPGEMLMEEYLIPLGISQTAFAERLHIPLQRLNELTRQKRGVTPDTALRLAQALGTSPEFWLNLQESWELWHAAHAPAAADIAAIEPLPRDADGALAATV